MQRKILSLLLVAALLPGTAAAWSAFGMSEPNTAFDQQNGWMYLTTDTSPDQGVRQVYFASFLGEYPGTTLSMNLGAVRSGFNAPVYAFWAGLGVWKDCNADGYVGLADSAVMEYRSEVLAATPGIGSSICPVQPTPNPIPLNWFPSHNDGHWVREFLPIQWYDVLTQEGDHNVWNVNANGARVWMDEGLPGANGAGNTCQINPQPVGTYRSTGGVIKWADCFTGFRITDTFDSVADSNPTLQPYSFSDDPRDQYHSGSQLNQKNPWGTESDASAVQAWDCSRPQLANENVHDPTGLVLTRDRTLNVSAPQVPPGVNPNGDAAGTANATGSGFDQCARNTHKDGAPSHYGDTAAGAPYSNEGADQNEPAKITAFLNLAPIELRHTNNTLTQPLGDSTPQDLGVPAAGYLATQERFDGTQLSQTTGLPVPSVNTPGAGGDGLWFSVPNEISGPRGFYMTAYAYVDPAAISAYGLSLPKSPVGSPLVTGAYGAENCGSFTTGIHNGWDCDATHWYKDANGHDTAPRSSYLGQDPSLTLPCTEQTGNTAGGSGCASYGALPGSPYDLQAITCYDQSFDGARQLGVSWDQTDPLAPASGNFGGAHCQFAS
jgi:hypothetical protein